MGYNTSTPGAGCQANGGKFGTRANAAGLKVGVLGYGDGANGTNIGGYFWAQNGGANYAVYAAWGESYFAGNVGIGTTNPAGKLDVNGSIYQRGAILHADYVFEPGYKLESIDEHSEFMWQEKHLPAMPKIQKDENGQEMVEIGARSKGIVEELEKAHIYIEQLNKENKELRAKLTTLDTRLDTIESLVTKLSLKQEGDIK